MACACCNQCTSYTKTGTCQYGGPFAGYERIEETKMWKPDIVLYHGGCNDGFGAAWACWKKWGGRLKTSGAYEYRIEDESAPVYHGMAYGGALPSITGKNVLMVDWSMKRDAMIEAAKSAKSIVVLDHHKTAQTELEPFTVRGMDNLHTWLGNGNLKDEYNVAAVFDMDKSGARLAWEFCFPGEEVPMMLQYIEDRDLWRQPPKFEETWAFTKALSARPQTFDQWDYITEAPAAFVDDGRAILLYHDKMVEDACQNVQMINIAGHVVPVVNVPYFLGSDSAALLLKKFPDAPFAGYYLKRGDGVVQWGLRSEDHRLDCSEIAKKFGGGGHRNASGFAVPGG